MPLTRIRQTAIGNDSITSAKLAHDLDLDGDFVRVPHGTTAQRPSSPVAGYMRFNTDQGTLEQWNTNTNSWQSIDSPPIITSLAYSGSVTAADPVGGETITLTGTNFKSGATVTIGGTSATSVSVVNSTTITFTTPAKTAGDYDVVVINSNGLQASLTNGISYNGTPAFTTAAGNLGSIVEDAAMSTITIVAAEPDGGTLAYSVTSGALPTGVSLGSANGQLTGTPNVNVTSDTTYNFTVTATDDENQTNSRAFNLIVLRPIYATQLTNSARFDANRATFLTRTPSSDGNRKTWTWSAWIKRANLSTSQIFFGVHDGGSQQCWLGWNSGNTIQFFSYQGSAIANVSTQAVFRDVSAWYHLVVAFDAVNTTMNMYVNGVDQTLTFNTAISNTDHHINSSSYVHGLGRAGVLTGNNADMYLSDVHFIDGQALTPTSFAEEYNGVWAPKAYSGSYGTNGFHLEFDDTNIVGNDTSGNNNDWASNNFNYSSITSTTPLIETATNMFDGSTSTSVSIAISTDNFIQWDAPSPISYSSSVEVYVYAANGFDITNYYSFNGGTETTFVGGGAGFNGAAWITVASGSGTLNSIKIRLTRGGGNSSSVNWYAIRVDGTILNGESYLGPSVDQIPDSPTTNFATFNYNNFPVMTFAEGALKITTTTNDRTVWGSQSIPDTGKWYFEMEATDYTSGGGSWNGLGYDTHLGDNELDQNGIRIATYFGGIYLNNSVQSGGYGNTGNGVDQTADGDVYSFAIDMDNELFYFAKNGTWYNSADPSSGTGGLDISANITAKGTKPYVPVVGRGASYNETYTWNFGQDSTFAGNRTATSNADSNGVGEFAYTVPTNFLSLCAKNRSESTINTSLDDRPEDYFNIVLWTGNGSSQSITDVGFQPDFVWLKQRNGTNTHQLLDSVRGKIGGAASFARLRTDTNAAQATPGSDSGLLSLDSNGFSLGNDTSYNGNTNTYVGWCWKAGGAPTATNSAGVGNVPTSGSVMIDGVASTSALAGTIAADKLSANTKTGFSIITYTANGSSSQTVAHGLTQTPEWVMVKNTQSTNNWVLWTPHLSSEHTMYPNLTNAMNNSPSTWYAGGMTSTTIGFDTAEANPSGGSPVAYCWHSVEGFSKIGTFIGNAQANGSVVYTGFKPSFIIIRNLNIVTQWYMVDNKIGNSTGNVYPNNFLYPNQTNAVDSPVGVDFLANGFKLRTTGSGQNGNGNTHIYLAFAEDPFKYSEAK